MEFVREYWPLILVAAALLLLVLVVVARPRQKVELSSDSAPARPHMAVPGKAKEQEGRGLADEAAAAVGDVSGQFISADVHENLPGASGPPDDLTRLKGVGPKFASTLNQLGIIRFDQLASFSEGDIDRLDQHLGAFKGRLERDQVPLQAEYLARGDTDGFEQRFGKL
jgi:predicted flap endonuclease-1-like 5' DNA nuclease